MIEIRKTVLLLSLLALAVSPAHAENEVITRIALGSCGFQWEDQSILNRVVESRPDIYLSLGDAIYADFDGRQVVPVTAQILQAEWDRLAALPAFKNLRENIPLMATWDNHDYGCHDCGAEFTLKTESEQIFLDFWQVPADAQVRKRPGVYQSRLLDSGGKRIQIILLDTRTFRDRQLLAERPEGTSGSLGKYAPNPDPNAKMLGAAQWAWLEEQLDIKADLRFIASSTQVIADQKGMDEWGNYPHERQRLLDLIEETGTQNTVLLSGNVHFSEVSRANVGESQVYDFTVSGLTHINEDYPQVPNPYRVAGPVVELNFGLVEIEWDAEDQPAITFIVKDSEGHTKSSYPVPTQVLTPTHESSISSETFGGPAGVSREQQDIEDILHTFRVDNRPTHLKAWYDWKDGLKQKTGFSFGINAQMVYAGVSDAIGEDDDAAGGIYRLQGEWVLFGHDTDHPGSIIFRLENRSRIGNGIPPGSLRGAIGSAATDPVFAYGDNFGTDFSVLAWQQLFSNKRAGIAAGLLDFSAYLDAMYYQTISRGFLNRSFILSPTLATTGIGALGAVGKGMIGDHFWIGGGFYDANARSGDPSFDTWSSSELLMHVEAGWTPGFDRRSTDRLQLTYWRKDRLDKKGTPEGAGWLLSYSMKVRERWVPFVRAGWSDGGGGALAKRSVAAGFAYQMAFQDWLTFGVGWNKPSDKTHGEDLASEKALETSYLWQVTANTSFLADVQVILDPALDPENDSLWMFGLRARLTF